MMTPIGIENVYCHLRKTIPVVRGQFEKNLCSEIKALYNVEQ